MVYFHQARAKVELREIATEQDAKDVLEIFEFGMSGVLDNDIVVSTTLSQLQLSAMSESASSSRSQSKNKVSSFFNSDSVDHIEVIMFI